MSQDAILLVLKRTLVIMEKMTEGLQVQEKGNIAGDVAEKIKDKPNESLMLVCVQGQLQAKARVCWPGAPKLRGHQCCPSN